MHLSFVSLTTPRTRKGWDCRSNWPYLIVKFLPYNGEFNFYIFSYTVDFYIWKLNSCRPMQFINSILKLIIWYILCIVHVFTLTVDTTRWIKFLTWFLQITGALAFSGDLISCPRSGETEVQGQTPYYLDLSP